MQDLGDGEGNLTLNKFRGIFEALQKGQICNCEGSKGSLERQNYFLGLATQRVSESNPAFKSGISKLGIVNSQKHQKTTYSVGKIEDFDQNGVICRQNTEIRRSKSKTQSIENVLISDWDNHGDLFSKKLSLEVLLNLGLGDVRQEWIHANQKDAVSMLMKVVEPLTRREEVNKSREEQLAKQAEAKSKGKGKAEQVPNQLGEARNNQNLYLTNVSMVLRIIFKSTIESCVN